MNVAMLDIVAEDEGSWEVDEAVAEITWVVVKVVEMVAAVLADPGSDDILGHFIIVEAVATSGVVFDAKLLVELSKAAVCES